MSRSFRIVTAALAALAGSAFAVAPAFADPSTSTVDQDASTSLIIHKHEGPTNTAPECTPNGQPVPESCLAGKTALAGATFDVYKVQDLKTNADWAAARAYAGGTFDTAGKPKTTVVTDASGSATFTGTVALYYVVESKTPNGYTGSVPFFVTLPMTDPAGDAWDYSVDVYPKNDKVSVPHKAVLDGNGQVADQSAVKVGDTLTYRTTVTIPNYGDVVGPVTGGVYGAPDGTYDHFDLPYFAVRDDLPADLEPVSVAVRIGGEQLLEDQDYNSYDNGVVFTQAGLDKLAQHAGQELTLDYVARVTSQPEAGTFGSPATVVAGAKPTQGEAPKSYTLDSAGTATNDVASKFGGIQVYKVGQTAGGEQPLGGATFAVYQADYSVAEGTDKITSDCSKSALQDNPVLDTFTTTANGQGISTTMLRLSTWYNDNVEQDGGVWLDGGQYAAKHGFQDYCLVETKAPQG